ncbi:MAG TPA: DMT family transporter [Verrucomicrobiae bacterium]|nr:DMT family transporter [Verrucomicrobiae bacterium]
MSKLSNNAAIAASLLATVICWGGNNAETKWLVATWPPVGTGCMRFLVAGTLLLGILRFTSWLGQYQPLTAPMRRDIFLRPAFCLAAYMVAFCWALHLTQASHVALCLGASPIWALLWEEPPQRSWSSARRYGAAMLACTGIIVLFWPALSSGKSNLFGDVLALISSVLWSAFSRQSRLLGPKIAALELAAHSMWMSGVWLLPIGLVEIIFHRFTFDRQHLAVQSLCIIFGGVVPYAFWNNALRHWQASRVLLFNNLIPVTTATWAHFVLGEPLTPTFWLAMILIVAGVVLGQMDWTKIFKLPENF